MGLAAWTSREGRAGARTRLRLHFVVLGCGFSPENTVSSVLGATLQTRRGSRLAHGEHCPQRLPQHVQAQCASALGPHCTCQAWTLPNTASYQTAAQATATEREDPDRSSSCCAQGWPKRAPYRASADWVISRSGTGCQCRPPSPSPPSWVGPPGADLADFTGSFGCR